MKHVLLRIPSADLPLAEKVLAAYHVDCQVVVGSVDVRAGSKETDEPLLAMLREYCAPSPHDGV